MTFYSYYIWICFKVPGSIFYFLYLDTSPCYALQALVSQFLLDDSTDDLSESYLGDSPGKLLSGSLIFHLVQLVYAWLLLFPVQLVYT